MEKEIVDAINASPYKAYVTVTGGGTSFIGDFLGFGGGSATILGFNVPYATEEFVEFISQAPDKFVSPDAARKLAVASFEKACKNVDRSYAVGVGCTASLRKDAEREGRNHLVFVAYHTAYVTRTIQVDLTGSQLGRADQERVSAEIILLALAEAVGQKIDWGTLQKYNVYCEVNKFDFPDVSKALDEGKPFMIANPLAQELLQNKDVVLFPGSFNPLHHGHMEIYEFAKKLLGVTPIFELSVTNVDKPSLSYYDIVTRWQNMGDLPLVLTNAPLMVNKIALFEPVTHNRIAIHLVKNLTIIMGLDTWERFARPPYDTEANIQRIKNFCNLKFIVNNRPIEGLKFIPKDGLNATFIPGLSINVSSSQIRKEQQQ